MAFTTDIGIDQLRVQQASTLLGFGTAGEPTLITTLNIGRGGTGNSFYAIGDMLYATGTTTLAKLAAGAAGNVLLSGTAPSWGKVALTTHVSGILPSANGGLGSALSDPGADRILFWDDSAGVHTYLTLGTNLSITDTTLNATGGGGGSGSVTSIDVSGGTTGLTATGGPVTVSGTITLAGTLAATSGGTGQIVYSVGDILYASTTTALSKLVAAASGNVLLSGATPSWGKVDLTSAVTGVLPIANGGTGNSSFTATRLLIGNGGTAITTDADLTFDGTQLLISGQTTNSSLRINAFEVESTSALNFILGNNTYYNGTNFVYRTTGATAYQQLSNDTFLWAAGASGTAAATYTPTTLMYLTRTEGLSIGNGSTTPTARLQVRGANNAVAFKAEDDAGNRLIEVGEASGVRYTKIDLGSDATGDIYYRNASGNLTRLPIGTEGQVIKATSGLPSYQNESGGGSSTWGTITGTLSSQTDLQTALNNKQTLDATLTALAAYNTNGILTQTAADTFTGRTLTGTTNKITITNGSGVAGNPTFTVGSDVVDKTITNTYTAGAKQVFTASATTAGFNIAETAAPSALLDGDMWHVTNTDVYARINGISMPLTRPAQTITASTSIVTAESDRNSVIHCTSNTTVNATLSNLTVGTVITFVKVGTGNIVVAPGGGTTLDAVDTTISTQYGAATFIKKSSTVWAGFGALGSFAGVTNTAGANELAKSDGTNIGPSGLFSTSNGNLLLGDSTLAGNRTITTDGSATSVSLSLITKGSSSQITLDAPAGGLIRQGILIRDSLTSPTIGIAVAASSTISYVSSITNNLSVLSPDGTATHNDGYDIDITAGDAYTTSGTGRGGNITVNPGQPNGAGTEGSLILILPTSPVGLPSGAAYWNVNVLTRVP